MHKNEDAIWLWGISVVCELWFAFSWLLTQLPKLFPINRVLNLTVLKENFESISSDNPTGKSDLPGIDVFVSIANSKKEPTVLEIANTILSVLAVDYPTEKLCSYVSDDAGNILTFEAMVEAASFAKLWIPFCRKHDIGCRNPEIYFNSTQDPYINPRHTDFVNDRRRLKREYDNFEDRINGLSDAIKRRSDAYYESEVKNAMEVAPESIEIAKATWMSNGVHWPGAWENPSLAHSYDHHSGMIQVILKAPSDEPLFGNYEEAASLDFTGIDMRLPMLVYVSREKHPEYEHHKKAGTLNALLRASAVMSNGPFILDLDCNQYIYDSQFLREGICFMMDWDGDQADQLCYVQFSQSFDPSDDCHVGVNMRALDGLQGPVYVGTGCLFRRIALYGFDPPGSKEHHAGCCSCCFPQKRKSQTATASEETHALHLGDYMTEEMTMSTFPQKFGNSSFLIDSIPAAELQGRPLADHPAIKYGRQPGILTAPREFLDASAVPKALSVISSGYEDKTEWGHCIGWIYGSESEDVVTGYRMHNRGWKSVYCVTKPDAFRRTAPMNLTDRLSKFE
ncbi:cellulose synthase-like protein D2 [Zingiber officinale]|nr:cellulose synthase-like protein D2 [Zingiber officinale]